MGRSQADPPTEDDLAFMRGYTRQPPTDDRLINAVRAALYAFPTQRLTQIIINATRGEWGEVSPTSTLWNIHDETLIDALEAYTNARQ